MDYPNEVSRVHPLGRVPWLPLYRIQGQDMYKELGSPDRAVVSLREGKLAILSCKDDRLVLASMYVRTWLSSWSCAHIAAWGGMVLQCWLWWHYWHVGGSLAVLCDVVSPCPLSLSPGLLGASYRSRLPL